MLSQNSFIDKLAEEIQKVSWRLPCEFMNKYIGAYNTETSTAAKSAMQQVIMNASLAGSSKRPVCQDTGMVIVFFEIGNQAVWDGDLLPDEMVNKAVQKAYTGYRDNILRASMVDEPYGRRRNTGDNTPAITHVSIIRGKGVKVRVLIKGGGSEFKTAFTVLNPGDSITDWIAGVMPGMGAGWCPPGIAGVGIGGSAEKAVLMSREALFAPLDIEKILAKPDKNAQEKLRADIYNAINNTGIGAQGFGGDTTVLDVLLKDYPTHAAILPVALTLCCSAARHFEFMFTEDGNQPAPCIDYGSNIENSISFSTDSHTEISLPLAKNDIGSLRAGDCVLLSGTIYTARDAAHRRLQECVANSQPLPENVDFSDACIYYAGPVEAVKGEVIGPAGPTTSKRMDKYTEFVLERLKVKAMIGKGERSRQTNDLIRKNGAVYFAAIGGAACFISKHIVSSEIVAYDDLGMEAIRKMQVKKLPVIVATDSYGKTIYRFDE